ncbi:MAG TPA: glycosyltransferase [Candidatus Limnocylindria bacterium]
MSDAPPEAQQLAEERAAARERRDFGAADELRDRLRSLGWEPVDGPSGSRLRPILPASPDAETGYARPEHLASRLDEPATLDASLVTLVDDHPDDLARLAAGLAAHPPSVSWELVVVANASDASSPAGSLPVTWLPTSARLGWADAANLGLRRTRGAVLVLLDGSVEPTGDFLSPLVAAFGDPTVGLAGPWGVTSADARHFADADPGPVDAVLGYCLALRREALAAVGGFDHRFRWYRHADLDLSFAMRDRGWRAVATDPLPLERHEHRGWSDVSEAERERLSRRNFYRFLDHWGKRPDLLVRRD